VGCKQYNTDSPALPEKSRCPRRVCLRKGCTEIFIPRVGNQRYCQTAQCLREVHRWQAALRQQKHRLRPGVRKAEAATAKAKRLRKSQLRSGPSVSHSPIVPAKTPECSGASSRSRKIFGPICQRVGCYEPPAALDHSSARYCGGHCRRAMQRVRDRERKWLWRNSLAGQIKCRMLATRRQEARQATAADRVVNRHPPATTHASDVVLASRTPPEYAVTCGDRKEDISYDCQNPEASFAPQTRPPPPR
jgi:hypothetical protein